MSIGGQIADEEGQFEGESTLPPGYRRYRYIDVSRETIDGSKAHSGKSLLRGELTAP